jgi:RNA polymerase sigma-70 factor (ECF subfamily)
MRRPPECEAAAALLGRLRSDPADGAAWDRFVRLYGPKVYGWCRRWRLQDADAHDVTQTVFLKLTAKLRRFAYDPRRSFHGWLRAVARNARSDYLASRNRPGRGRGGDDARLELDRVSAPETGGDCGEGPFDRELLDRAVGRVRRRVAGRTWEAFRRTALEGQSGEEASASVGLRVAQVFVARYRVLKLLRQEVRRLAGADLNRPPWPDGRRRATTAVPGAEPPPAWPPFRGRATTPRRSSPSCCRKRTDRNAGRGGGRATAPAPPRPGDGAPKGGRSRGSGTATDTE